MREDIVYINTDKAADPIGPFSHGTVANGFLFVSGQGGFDEVDGSIVSNQVAEQAKQTFKNIQYILEEAGTDFEHIVKVNCYLRDMKDFDSFNEVYVKYIKKRPARTCIAVRELPGNLLCEVELIALVR